MKKTTLIFGGISIVIIISIILYLSKDFIGQFLGGITKPFEDINKGFSEAAADVQKKANEAWENAQKEAEQLADSASEAVETVTDIIEETTGIEFPKLW